MFSKIWEASMDIFSLLCQDYLRTWQIFNSNSQTPSNKKKGLTVCIILERGVSLLIFFSYWIGISAKLYKENINDSPTLWADLLVKGLVLLCCNNRLCTATPALKLKSVAMKQSQPLSPQWVQTHNPSLTNIKLWSICVPNKARGRGMTL